MKLLFCEKCWDIFKLTTTETRQCECGRVKGRYINESEAEVNGQGVSLAIGNGSLWHNILYGIKITGDRRKFIEECSFLAWVRPHEGPGNPHTKVNKKL